MPRTKQTTNHGSSSGRDDSNIERWLVSSQSKHLYRTRLLTSEPIFGKARASSSHGDPMDTGSIPRSNDPSKEDKEENEGDMEGDDKEEDTEEEGDHENEDEEEEEEDNEASDGANNEGHDD
ncbi:M phase phosphoprotein 10-like [Malania oleifera]|uniref:M phase phosphoprotein 10-like n=1 Tax=Malania oleifera TaxID=397392 RepID=UPI0025AE18D4|nr:M phase phosphoprotein 10-like [Malania oleifera]